MVVGAGIAGVQAALDLANSGFYVHLVEKKSAIGGVMAQLDKTFPTNDCAMCIISPKLVECGRHLNIQLHTLSEVKAISGEPGRFMVTVEKEPRYVDPAKCTGCAACTEVCPVRLSDEFNLGLAESKAISRLYPQAIPSTFAIKKADRAPCVLASWRATSRRRGSPGTSGWWWATPCGCCPSFSGSGVQTPDRECNAHKVGKMQPPNRSLKSLLPECALAERSEEEFEG